MISTQSGSGLDLLAREFRIQLDEPMARHTSFRIGGPAGAYLNLQSAQALQAAAAIAAESSLEVLYVGAGSNLLV